MFRKIMSALSAVFLVCSQLTPLSAYETESTQPSETHAAAEGINVDYHTVDEIRGFIAEHGPAFMSPVYDEQPDPLNPPYAPGQLSEAYLNDAINALNTARYIAGLDADVTLNASYTAMTQAGTLINAINNVLTHTPSKPEGIDDDLYTLGYRGCSSSNIGWGYTTLSQALFGGWLNDGDSSNIQSVGHRRWALNASMKQTGFGHTGAYTAMYAFDRSGSAAKTSNVWPAQNMPLEYFGRYYPWSVSTGNSEDINAVTVTMTDVKSGKVHTFSQAGSDGYFNVDNNGYGVSGAIIWRPSDIDDYKDDDEFHIEISGLKAGTIRYNVRFFELFGEETLRMDPDALILEVGEEADVYPEFLPRGIIDRLQTFSTTYREDECFEASFRDGHIHVKGTALGKGFVFVYSYNGAGTSFSVTVVDKSVEPESVSLDPETMVITVGSDQLLSADVLPANAAQTVIWQSSDESIAEVNPDGWVTGVSEGSAIITAKTWNGLTAECRVTVTHQHIYGEPEYFWADDLSTATASAKCEKCDEKLTETVKTEYAVTEKPGCEEEGIGTYTAAFTNKKFYAQTRTVSIPPTGHAYDIGHWEWAEDHSSCKAVFVCKNDERHTVSVDAEEIMVDETYEVIYYTAKVVYEGKVYSDTETVWKVIMPSSVTLNVHEKAIRYHETLSLKAVVKPDKAADQSLTWSSSDRSVASVDQSGNVTGLKPGLALITTETVNGIRDTCEVRVLFSDVADPSRYFYETVYWAVDNGITVGYGGPDLFSPDASCTREQIVTFLWRLEGEPEPLTSSDFTDVRPSDWYYKPITWAAENSITVGLNDGTGRFGVGQPCTREQCVTFLHRAEGKPAVSEHIVFTDVAEDKYYYDSISWAAANRITVGLNDGTGRFGVGQKCTRAMIVTFLGRYDGLK